MATLTPGGFLFRWLGALVLVLGTYNPTRYNYIAWILDETTGGAMVPLKFLIGALIVIGYVIYFRATLESIGYIGIFLALGFFGGIVWLLIDMEILDLRDWETSFWIILFILATIMAIGMSWSIIRRKLTGQVDQI